ncbi:serine hydrolase domain-containing protein [Parasphingorhabdus sp.]|uniref:serine hydrolase domain-containing protein n=1 Tax=Parasphingorhabdus sp. TaxID=2709688 RepID=UPI0035930298
MIAEQRATRSPGSSFSRRSVLGGIGAGTFLAGMPAIALAQPMGTSFPGLTKIINEYVASKKVAGMLAMIGFGQAAPQVIAAGSLRLGGDKLVDSNTLWRMYSQTKPVTGMATMMLIEDGLISLDQPLSDFFPEFANMQVLVDPEGALDQVEPARTPITIRHLQTHTAGLGYTIISKGPIQKAYLAAGLTPGRISRSPIPGLDVGAPTPDIMTFVKRLAEMPLVYQPGTQWSYSLSHDVLSAVIEKVSGKPLDQFLQERMFGPLGMTSIFYNVPAERAFDLADNYAPFAGSLIPVDPGATSIFLDRPPFAFGSTGLVGTAGDYDRFLQMLLGFGKLGDVQVMQPDTVKLGMSNLLPETANTKGTWVANHGFGAGGRSGLGTEISPAGTFGWGGAAGTSAFVDTVRGLRAGGYTQYIPSNSYPFQSDFPKYVYADLIGNAQAGSGNTSP